MGRRTRGGVLVVGDVILDRDLIGDVTRVCPDAPAPVLDVRRREQRPGGAGLAALLLADGHRPVRLATCLGDDDAGDRVREALAGRVGLTELGRLDRTRSVTRLRSGVHSLARIDENGSGLPPEAPLDVDALEEVLAACDAVLVADYGAGVASHPAVRTLLARWATRRPVVWDPHPRGLPPVAGTTVATPNRSEVVTFSIRAGSSADEPLDRLAVGLRDIWAVHAVAATDGAAGVFTALADSPPLFTPTPFAGQGDTCGAGDRFAGAVATALAAGAVITEAVQQAVQETAGWLAGGGVGSLTSAPVPSPSGRSRVEAVRAGGGRVVATGGCFDVLHAGHVASLRAARRLGDCLVVLLNSDAAVRRLKGPDRPVHTEADRAAVLSSLECVDAVVVFDEDTPAGALTELRPHVWAKGADYAGATLPEADLVRAWGGRVVLLPYLPGRSTTAILQREGPR
jgi:rfaE bifunctional protein nucleotidyltransferase chain/domain/rfaE bifunctional protein kinase chain/domain